MNRLEIFSEMEKLFGRVPSFFKGLPDSYIEAEWSLFKNLQLGETTIPNKYKELMGVAISSVQKCHFCTYFHTEAARLNGASEQEIQEAVHFAKHTAGWSTYLNGMQFDLDDFKKEVDSVMNYIRKNM